ncbi:hypothetical protein TanjilG_26764 [Lupinus angustifolius]|uniref:BZIP domain-containing protein n=2 Tax=Lupinus angustifolius TaxID=3871 RepID=A0A1J7GGE9_LUPAN|nr:hypothetical protein TanjilG_26764 [Lupinus angustifolius]
MDGDGSSVIGKGPLPTTTPGQNTMLGSYDSFEQETNGVLNPIEGDVPNDPDAQRRARNRNYSKTYRLKKQDHMLKLEDQVKTLNETLSTISSELEYYKEVQSNLEVETNSLVNTLTEISLSFDGDEANPELLMSDLMEVKQLDENQQARKSEMVKNIGK